MIKIEVEGVAYEHDPSHLMLSEARVLQDLWGLDFSAVNAAVTSGQASMDDLVVTVWLVKVRKLAAEQGIPFRAAAEQLPPADFDFNLGSMKAEVVQEAPNPTAAGTRTKGTRTTRATSARPRKSAG